MESKAVSQHMVMSNWEMERFHHLSNPIYPLEQGEPEPSLPLLQNMQLINDKKHIPFHQRNEY